MYKLIKTFAHIYLTRAITDSITLTGKLPVTLQEIHFSRTQTITTIIHSKDSMSEPLTRATE
uniref:Uncharacterized protein n=1 Tax=Anguilla anguilla TaxID=7936 RepID=A0A0E9XRG5_ANGAN